MSRPTKKIKNQAKCQVFDWLEKNGIKNWSDHLITGPKWDHFGAVNRASEHHLNIGPQFVQHSNDSRIQIPDLMLN